jgi:hypothetical protein
MPGAIVVSSKYMMKPNGHYYHLLILFIIGPCYWPGAGETTLGDDGTSPTAGVSAADAWMDQGSKIQP